MTTQQISFFSAAATGATPSSCETKGRCVHLVVHLLATADQQSENLLSSFLFLLSLPNLTKVQFSSDQWIFYFWAGPCCLV